MMDRRAFTGLSTAAGAAIIAAPAILSAQTADVDVIRIGLVGCGERGTGAVTQALHADPKVKLVAMADTFSEQLSSALGRLSFFGDRVDVPVSRRFVGLDGFVKLLDAGVDVVFLCTPPAFRPQQLRAAVEAGKHIFAEKPMAVDMAGVKSVLETTALARKKRVSIQHGYCWRFDPAVREMYRRINAGEWGRVVSLYGSFLVSPPKVMLPASARQKGWSDIEWQLRNWINFMHFSGGPLIEQGIHAVDKISWSMKDVAPVAAVASGGLMRDHDGGNIYDHYNVAYEYPGGVFCQVAQRQFTGVHHEIIDRIFCSEASLVGPMRPTAFSPDKKRLWSFSGKNENMYQVCHNEFFAALREGELIDSGDYLANSTALGLLGREAAHSGMRVTWEELWKSNQDLAPDDLKMDGAFTPAPIPQPGKYDFS